MNLFTDTTQPCHECDALDDSDCECRYCTKCGKHENECECEGDSDLDFKAAG